MESVRFEDLLQLLQKYIDEVEREKNARPASMYASSFTWLLPSADGCSHLHWDPAVEVMHGAWVILSRGVFVMSSGDGVQNGTCPAEACDAGKAKRSCFKS